MNKPDPVVYTKAEITVVIHPEEPAVVAYWFPEDRKPVIETDGSPRPPVADVCAQTWPGARRFFDLAVMARIYKMDLS